jgi:hypothetical protein
VQLAGGSKSMDSPGRHFHRPIGGNGTSITSTAAPTLNLITSFSESQPLVVFSPCGHERVQRSAEIVDSNVISDSSRNLALGNPGYHCMRFSHPGTSHPFAVVWKASRSSEWLLEAGITDMLHVSPIQHASFKVQVIDSLGTTAANKMRR